jgi:hypothetical protein
MPYRVGQRHETFSASSGLKFRIQVACCSLLAVSRVAPSWATAWNAGIAAVATPLATAPLRTIGEAARVPACRIKSRRLISPRRTSPSANHRVYVWSLMCTLHWLSRA